MNAPTIIGGYSTNDALRRLEQCGKQHGYRVEEWLIPSATGGVRVTATMSISGAKHGLGFKWNGEDINVLVQRCMALDLSMTTLPEAVAKSKGQFAQWKETEH